MLTGFGIHHSRNEIILHQFFLQKLALGSFFLYCHIFVLYFHLVQRRFGEKGRGGKENNLFFLQKCLEAYFLYCHILYCHIRRFGEKGRVGSLDCF